MICFLQCSVDFSPHVNCFRYEHLKVLLLTAYKSTPPPPILSVMDCKLLRYGKGGGPKKNYFFSSLLLLRGPWAIKILGPYFDVTVDAMGPKTDFTLEANRKK